MAIKKSDLYSSLWASCDQLRGGMDAGQYKDYVLFMLFIKYISDKYADSDDFAPPVVIPQGASFKDMVALKGKPDIGDKINTQIIQPLIDKNARLARSDFANFNDPEKLGTGAEMVERLTNLISIFQKPELDFSKNRAEHDDILGDAYEYLMRHFATESGKSKGQFYTPSEVSRVIAKVIGILPQNTKASTTAYDPTCGSGSLLLKVAAEAGKHITLEGQEKDVTTAGLARMNMILHDFPTANVQSGNTLANPKFLDGQQLRTYDYVVANPPFSDKTWSTGLNLADEGKKDSFQRFSWGLPSAKQGDYRRIQASLTKQSVNISEKVVQRLMKQERLVAVTPKRRRYGSYMGEISPAPDNLLNRDFSAVAPNEKWLTDITKFQLPAGKVYLSPMIDCLDGMVVSWSIGARPDAELVNTKLDAAIETVATNDDRPVVHSDRGGHYRWPGWLSRIADAKLVRSMSRKRCSPDNAACEGFFGRLKQELFYSRNRQSTTVEDFVAALDAYIRWYNEARIKISLGSCSPIEHRRNLGLAA